MPQFDVSFFFNNILYFTLMSILFYVIMVRYIMPLILKVLKIKRQKITNLNKVYWLVRMRSNAIFAGNTAAVSKMFTLFTAIISRLKK